MMEGIHEAVQGTHGVPGLYGQMQKQAQKIERIHAKVVEISFGTHEAVDSRLPEIHQEVQKIEGIKEKIPEIQQEVEKLEGIQEKLKEQLDGVSHQAEVQEG